MSALIIELFGQDLAEKLNGFSVTKCKIFREEKRVSVGLSCPDVPMKELVDELKGAIRTRFGIQDVELLMEHPDLVLNDETKDAVWENLKMYLAEQFPAAKRIFPIARETQTSRTLHSRPKKRKLPLSFPI